MLIVYNLSSYYVGAPGYELPPRGGGKVKLLECPHIAAFVQPYRSWLFPPLLPAAFSSQLLPTLERVIILMLVHPLVEYFSTYYFS